VDAVVRVRLLHRKPDFVRHPLVDRVQPLGPVERDSRDAVLYRVFQRGKLHRGSWGGHAGTK